MKKDKIVGLILVIISIGILIFESYLRYQKTGEIDDSTNERKR